MTNEFKNKTILVTGGTGTIGSRLVAHLLTLAPKQIRVFSRDESKQYDLLEHLQHNPKVRFLIGDVRDRERLELALQGVDIVFHAAAMKHVPFCEYNPFETVKTNVLGSQNLIDAALKNNVAKVVAISTDKVVNPVGVMGTSKLMMEKLFVGANYYKGDMPTKFACVRFGNVTWARGSVLPLWKSQAVSSGAIRITDKQMTRFFMSQQDAVSLVFEAARLMRGGEVFVFKMPAIKILDLAKMFVKKYFPGQKIKLEITGKRAGEKQHEELIGTNEGEAEIFEDKKMFIIRPRVPIYSLKNQKPGNYPGFRTSRALDPFSSKNHLASKNIKNII